MAESLEKKLTELVGAFTFCVHDLEISNNASVVMLSYITLCKTSCLKDILLSTRNDFSIHNSMYAGKHVNNASYSMSQLLVMFMVKSDFIMIIRSNGGQSSVKDRQTYIEKHRLHAGNLQTVNDFGKQGVVSSQRTKLHQNSEG